MYVVQSLSVGLVHRTSSMSEAKKYLDYFKKKYPYDEFMIETESSNSTSTRKKIIKKRISTGSKSRVSSKTKRKNLYDWAWKQKGKGSISRIGKKMKSLSKTKGLGAKVAVRQLGRIGDLKAAFNAGVKSRKR